jgi:hypothetical protein
MLCASLLAGGSFASVASARHHLSKAQKAKIRAKLRREVKANPRVVLKKSFMRQAGQVSFTLPVTLRFRNSDGNVPSTLNLDLGTLGVKSIALQGYLSANATFIDPSASGTLGELRVSIPPVPPGTVGGTIDTGAAHNHVLADAGTATLRASPLSILTNPDVSNVPITNATGSGCQGYAGAGLGTANSPGVGIAAGGYAPGTSDPADNPLTVPSGIDTNTVFRTPYLPIGVAPVVPQTGSFTSPGPFSGPSGGNAYLFGNPSGGPSVDVTLNALTNINSILRDVNTGNALFVGLGRQCAQTWTGYVPNVLTAHVTGSLSIQPDITNDGRLRLAVATLTGGSTPDPIKACVAPYSQYGAPAVPALSAINIGGLNQNPFSAAGVNTAIITEQVVKGDPTTAPAVPCGTTNAGVANPAAQTVGTLGGQVLLKGKPGDPFPSGNAPLAGIPNGLPGVTVPQPCPPTTAPATGVTSGGCEISLNGTLTPGTLTADVLIGQAVPLTSGGTDFLPATNQTPGSTIVGNL